MNFNRKTSLMMACFVLFTLFLQMDLSIARPSRASRRSKASRDKQAKRSWQETSPPVIVDNGLMPLNSVDTVIFPSTVEKDAITDSNTVDAKGSEKSPPNKWLELERTLPAVVNAPIHSDLTLECVAVGSPPPRVYWLKDGKPIDHMTPFDMDQFTNHVYGWDNVIKRNGGGDGGRDFSMANVKAKLPLRCLRPEDQGEYTCLAENDGRQLVANTVVTIDDTFTPELRPECILQYTKKGKKIQPAFIMSYEYLHMETIGSDVILTCRVVGRPRPQVTWLDFEGKTLHNGKKFRVTESGNLVIKNLSWREMGEYTCRAENEFGTDSASTFLYPLLNESSS